MLDPDYIDRAGDMVGAVYGEIETDMLAYLSKLLLDKGRDAVGQRGLTAINLLAQTHAADLLAIIEKHKGAVSVAVAAATSAAIGRSDALDAAALAAAGLSAGMAAATLPRQVELTIKGIAEILARDNVEMTTGALDLWNRAVSEAVTKVNTGALTADKAIHEAVRKMMREGITAVQYRNAETGRQTVRNQIDVAVRRHVRTQIAQDGARRTMQVCEDAGISLVEVSSHGGARPSHAKWQGRVYSLKGDVTIDGVRYKDFYRETGYGSVDGLLGANCRHSFGPWVPGTPRMYSPDPEHPSGLSNDEVYALTQKQRAGERAIRQTKRDLKAAQLIYDDSGDLNDLADVLRLQDKLKGQQKRMRDLIADANKLGKADVLQRSPAREWAGDMPKIAKSSASRRTLTEFMKRDATKQAIKRQGLTQAEGAQAIRQEVASRELTTQGFWAMSKSEQNELGTTALKRKKQTEREARRASMKPANEALYFSQTNYVKRHGGVVMRGGEDVERHLDNAGADGICITGGKTILLRENPTTSEVLEEVYHFQQDERGDYAELGAEEMRLRREIDAQNYLLGVIERYNIPESETAQTHKALKKYKEDLKKLIGGEQ